MAGDNEGVEVPVDHTPTGGDEVVPMEEENLATTDQGSIKKEVGENNKPEQEDSAVKALLDRASPDGLSTKEYEAAIEEHGFNEVVVKEPPIWLQILSKFLGIVPLFITLTAVLSAAIESTCLDPEDE
jgi:magnesium-transporting ATPase (P-type)